MEFLISGLTLAVLLALVLLAVTGGKPKKLLPLAQRVWAAAGRNRAAIGISGLAFVLVIGFLFFYYFPPATWMGPVQPIPFSHRVHAGIKGIACQFCHPYTRRSTYPGLPPVQKCLFCHNYIITGHPMIKKEHELFNTDTPPPWRKIFYLPEHVLFNHQRHIRKDVACQQCHGAIETMDRLKRVRFKMGFCIKCHQQKKAELGCWLACHS